MNVELRRAGQSDVERASAYCHFVFQPWILARCHGDSGRWNIDNWVLQAYAFRF